MKQKYHNLKILLIVSMVVVGGIALWSIIAPSTNIFSFQLLPLSFQGNVINPSIDCNAGVKNFLHKGNLIRDTASAFLSGSPSTTFSLIADTQGLQDPVNYFDVQLRMRCQVDGNTPITVVPENFKLAVWSQDSGKNKIKTFEQVKKSTQKELNFDHEETLVTFKVSSDDILQDLDKGNYRSWQEFKVSGNLVMHYKDYPTVKYALNVPEDTVRTWFEIHVEKDVEASDVVSSPNIYCPSPSRFVSGVGCVINPVDKENISNEQGGTESNDDVNGNEDLGTTFNEFYENVLLGDYDKLNDTKFSTVWIIIAIIGILIVTSIVKSKD